MVGIGEVRVWYRFDTGNPYVRGVFGVGIPWFFMVAW